MPVLIKPSIITQEVIEIPSSPSLNDNFWDDDFFGWIPAFQFMRSFNKKVEKPKSGHVIRFPGRTSCSNCIIQFEPDEIQFEIDNLLGIKIANKKDYVFEINNTEILYGGVRPLFNIDDSDKYECGVDYIKMP
jgi:hypothetical protein